MNSSKYTLPSICFNLSINVKKIQTHVNNLILKMCLKNESIVFKIINLDILTGDDKFRIKLYN